MSEAAQLKPGDVRCDIDPSPMYASATYTMFSPGQSEVEPDFTPGWDTQYAANQIAWEPNPCAPACIADSGIENYDQWVDWFYCNIIRLFCDWANMPCHLLVGGKLMSVADTLSTCIGLTTEKNTIVYDTEGKTAIAGAVATEDDCYLWMNGAAGCIKDAETADGQPGFILGRLAGDNDKPYKFPIKTQPLTRLIHKFELETPQNVVADANTGVRMVPLATLPVITSPNEGSSYSATTGKITIGKDGFYRFGCHTYVEFTYATKVGKLALIEVLAGFVIEAPVTLSLSEIRTFEAPIWREHGTTQRICVKWTNAMYFKAGTKITPRIWLVNGDTTPLNTDLVSFDDYAQVSLYRVADHNLSF